MHTSHSVSNWSLVVHGVDRHSEELKDELKYQDLFEVTLISKFRLLTLSQPRSSDYLNGEVKIDEYVTHHRKLADINEGFHDMHVIIIVYVFGYRY